MVYYLTPLYAAGSITETEIYNLEVDIKRKGFGLMGDFTSVDIQKLLSPQVTQHQN
jgi:hypothetical protein